MLAMSIFRTHSFTLCSADHVYMTTASVAGIKRITDKMLYTAAVACADSMTQQCFAEGRTFPKIQNIRSGRWCYSYAPVMCSVCAPHSTMYLFLLTLSPPYHYYYFSLSQCRCKWPARSSSARWRRISAPSFTALTCTATKTCATSWPERCTSPLTCPYCRH